MKNEENKCTIGVKWVFKINSDGRYSARIVALGYLQLYGIDYEDVHAPVLHEVTFRLMLLTKLLNGWKILKIDVEAAFMEVKLEEEIYTDRKNFRWRNRSIECSTVWFKSGGQKLLH